MTYNEAIAHVRPLDDTTFVQQPLLQHLQGVAQLAQRYAERISWEPGFGQIAYLLGILHDVGKYQEGFQRYIRKESGMDSSLTAGRTPHSPVGALYAHQLKREGWGDGLCKLLSICIASHHRGLYDDVCWREQVLNLREVKRAKGELLEGLQGDLDRLESYLDKASIREIEKAWSSLSPEEYSLLIRMLFSCLVDADFLDTEQFMSPDRSLVRQTPKSTLAEMREQLGEYVSHFNRDGRINEVRATFLQQCRDHGQTAPRGIYSLTLPTGAGKTISSMMWAIEHALARGCDRIIYVIPYTSIITQTAQIFRDIFGEDNVLEHHSDIDVKERDDETMEYAKLMTENWDVPLVVTTNVQFFESLYSHRVGRCRKLHNICNSVVVFDEVQMFPPKLLNPILQVIESLHYGFRVEPLFCTATLPVFDKDILSKSKRVGHQFFFLDKPIEEVIPYDSESFVPFDKVTYHWDLLSCSTRELAGQLSQHESFLCIVNSRKDAVQLYDALRELDEEDEGLIHLSRYMCSVHIQERIREIRERLKEGLPVRVVSTPLVEAGVDFDFPVVYRAMAGLDSVMQAAGRCNREGRITKPGDVYIFCLTDGTSVRGEMLWAQGALKDLLDGLDGQGTPRRADIEQYYQAYYGSVGSFDQKGISTLLWGDDDDPDRCEELRFDYEEASARFKYIDDKRISVVVPYGEEGKALVHKLCRNIPLTLQDYRQLHRLSVALYEKDCLSLEGGISASDSGVVYLTNDNLYQADTGIQLKDMTSGLLTV